VEDASQLPKMKTFRSLLSTRSEMRGSLFCLWFLTGLLPVGLMGQTNYSNPYTFTTLAGSDAGIADGTGSGARFGGLISVAVDVQGNVYVADSSNETIRRVTPAGVVTTLAGLAGSNGTNDGTGSAARFYFPEGVAVDTNGNVYVSDSGNNAIRKVTAMGVVTTLAGSAGTSGTNDGAGSAARFNQPSGIAVDSAGNVYVADTGSHTIRKVTSGGVVTTLAGLAGSYGSANGTGSAARFNQPSGVAADTNGNVYVGDSGNYTIRKVTSGGVATTLAGQAGVYGSADGTGSGARFLFPKGVSVDAAGNVYVADYENYTIRKVTSAGVVTTLAGLAGSVGSADGTGSVARFNYPQSVAADTNGNVYVADSGNYTVRKAALMGANWVVTTLAGVVGGPGSADGAGGGARFANLFSVAVDSAGNVYVADRNNYTLRKATPAGVVTTLAGLSGSSGSTDGTGSVARFFAPVSVAVDGASNVYVADYFNCTIRKATPAGTNWAVTTLAGQVGVTGTNDGTGSAAQFHYPEGVAVDRATNVYVSDTYNHTIRKLTMVGANWVVTTLAGLAGSSGTNDGIGSAARFYGPTGLAVDSATNLYVADSDNSTIRKITAAGVVTTLAGLAGSFGNADGTGSAAQFYYPEGVAVDGATNLYVADYYNDAIRKVTPAGAVTTLGGLGSFPYNAGSADGTGIAARFHLPQGVAVDSMSNVYVADSGNSVIRKGVPATSVPAPYLYPPSLSMGQVAFGVSGLPGLAVNIETSGDLTHWQLMGTYVLYGGTNYIINPTPPPGGQFSRGHVR
jgi:NHL repeat